MSLLIGILVFVIVAGVIYWAINALVGAFGIPQPLATVIQVVVILILLIAFLDMSGVLGGGLHFGTLR